MANTEKDFGDGPELDPLTDAPRDTGQHEVTEELPEAGASREDDGTVFPDADQEENAVRDESLPGDREKSS